MLIHGDCLQAMQGLADDAVDLVLTDIPYGEVNRASGGLRNLNKGIADIVTFSLKDFISACIRVCNGSFYVFCGIEQVSEIRALFVQHGLATRMGIWEKTNPSPMNGQRLWLSSVECCVFARKSGAVFNEHCKSSVWRSPLTRSKIHPTQKPVALFSRLIQASTNPDMRVLDPCMGSGTTGVCCKQLGRRFIGIEKDAGYFAAAKLRIENEESNEQTNGGTDDRSIGGLPEVAGIPSGIHNSVIAEGQNGDSDGSGSTA